MHWLMHNVAMVICMRISSFMAKGAKILSVAQVIAAKIFHFAGVIALYLMDQTSF